MARVHLNVKVPKNRNNSGTMEVIKEGMTIAVYNVLARGSRGPGNTQFQTNGNTPTGGYKSGGIKPTKHQNQDSYGPHGKVLLSPTSGNAQIAGTFREHLLIHGGSLATKGFWKGKIKPTHGCLRLSNDDMKQLIEILNTADSDGKSSSAPEITVDVKEF